MTKQQESELNIFALPIETNVDIKDDAYFLGLAEQADAKFNTPIANKSEKDNLCDTAKLIALTKEHDFFRCEQNHPYVSFDNNGCYKTYSLDSSDFKSWLSGQFWRKKSKPISKAALERGMDVMRAKAIHEGTIHRVFNRVGFFNGRYYIDLTNAKGEIIEVMAGKWSVLQNKSLKFKTISAARSLPSPIHGKGNLALLWQYLNIPKKERILVLAFILECFRLNTNYPILVLQGMQDSAKSTTQRFMRSLIDPNVANLRGSPKRTDDIYLAAINNYIVEFNNVSHLTKQDQDDMCCLSTGGAHARRELYTTSNENAYDIKRPLILNGISNFITEQDLLSRCIIIYCPQIPNTERKTEEQLNQSFEYDSQFIFTALLDLFAETLRVLPEIHLDEKPRMVDFAKLGVALEIVGGHEKGTFMRAYNNNIKGCSLQFVEDSPIVRALMNYLDENSFYEGNYAKLVNELQRYCPIRQKLPTDARVVCTELKKMAPALKLLGIKISFSERRGSKGYSCRIEMENVDE